MTRWFTPTSLQFSTSSWHQSRFRTTKKSTIKHRHVKQYQLLNELGHGSTCVVYLALDTTSEKLYALKEMNLKTLQRQQCLEWLQSRHPKHQQQKDGSKRRRIESTPLRVTSTNYTESNILHSLHHDRIIEWIDCFEDNHNLYLVTEWVDGTVLVNLHGDELKACHSVFTQLVDVLDHLHEHNIIHGDIKPDNILLTKSNQVKLIDFGSAFKLNATDNNNTIKCQKSTFHRTPAFTPPECIKKEMANDIITTKQYETAADIWSLGMTLYCMVYGKLPFPITNKQLDLYHTLQTFTAVPHTNKDPQLCHLLDQMLKVSPIERITLNQIKQHPWFLGNAT